MKSVIILYAVFTYATAAVIPEEAKAEIVNYESSNDGSGSYKFSYETSNGITQEETGHLVNIGQKDEHMVVEGSYTYIDVEGNPVVIIYTSDENGYQISLLEIHVVSNLPETVVATLLG